MSDGLDNGTTSPADQNLSSFGNLYFYHAKFQRNYFNKNDGTNVHSLPNHRSINGSCTGNLSMTETNLIPPRQRENQDTETGSDSQTGAQVRSGSRVYEKLK